MSKEKGCRETKVTLQIAKKAIQITQEGRRRLTLSKMRLTTFPKCLFKLTKVVEELDLSCNMIQKLPENIKSFSLLCRLDLHSNKLKSVPNSIGDLVGLTHLNLANNCLTSAGLPSSLGTLTNLKSLNLGLNQLDSLPPSLAALRNLQELGLFDNLFTRKPEFVKGLHNLNRVNTRGNPLMNGEGDGMREEKLKPKELTFLVHQNDLCPECFKRCTSVRPREKMEIGGGDRKVVMHQDKRKWTYQRLMVPNLIT